MKRLLLLPIVGFVALGGCASQPGRSPSVTIGGSAVHGTFESLFSVMVGVFTLSVCIFAGLTFVLIAGLPNQAGRGEARWWSSRLKRASRVASAAGIGLVSGAVWALFWRGFGDSVILLGASVGVGIGVALARVRKKSVMADWRTVRRWDSVASFVDLLGDPDPCVQAEAMSMLASRLPATPVDIIERLSRSRRRRLYRHLDGSDVLLARAVLAVAEGLRDCEALPYVERLIGSSERAHCDDDLLAAARGCRDLLVQRRSDSARADSLLRPAEATREDLLVRPTASFDSDSGLLLPASLSGIDRLS